MPDFSVAALETNIELEFRTPTPVKGIVALRLTM
jgi:hypothetical protein